MPQVLKYAFLSFCLLPLFNTRENHSNVTANASMEWDNFYNTLGNVSSQLIQQSCEMFIV